jgi:4'-phosphopantetheinyl transferase
LPDVHLWYRFTDRLGNDAVGRLESGLSADERARARRFRHEVDRRDFVAAHSLLRHALECHAGLPARQWRFRANHQGKPVLEPYQVPGVEFNLSHTPGLVACAVAGGAEVGVDVEAIDRSVDIEAVGGLCLSDRERGALLSLVAAERAGRFFEMWTLKEALAKATGLGVASLDRWSVQLVGDEGLRVQSDGSTCGRWLCLLASPSSRYRLALAVRAISTDTSCRVHVRKVDGNLARTVDVADGVVNATTLTVEATRGAVARLRVD